MTTRRTTATGPAVRSWDSRAARRSADRPVANGAGTASAAAARDKRTTGGSRPAAALVPRRGHEGQRAADRPRGVVADRGRPARYTSDWNSGWSGVRSPRAVRCGWAEVAMHRRMQRRIARMEQTRALEWERDRIARDLHDEIGAGLTEIAMQSDWVRRDLAGANLPTRNGGLKASVSRPCPGPQRRRDRLGRESGERHDRAVRQLPGPILGAVPGSGRPAGPI